MNIRLQSIVLEYGIEDRMINVDNLGQILLTDLNLIDYQRCITITNKKHDDAINFLKNNLEA